MSYVLTTLTKKQEVDSIIRSTIDFACLLLDDALAKTAREISKFATSTSGVLIPSTIFFFNAHHKKMDSGTADHSKWVGAFQQKQNFIDVVEAIFRGAMKGKIIVNCPLPPERIPKYQFSIKMCRSWRDLRYFILFVYYDFDC
ncbi:thioredoxin-like protein 4B [Pyrus ussuriensis x Pyrus communis]|uniref:Thioredoxin-like protein 4B n=1 Tax=Pyrus ussuriensis x Pyrus communis TaxID=2448454 RepID=A0A5N5GHZ3_9ROSA|nr:thioredoxin-like protein 4B [Pyrus ussuriensis x Pyrus communis]